MNPVTRVLTISEKNPEPSIISVASQAILEGKLVAFPTETVYGLGANALNPEAVSRIFSAKGRPAEDPLIVHLASPADLPRVTMEVPPMALLLAQEFWPGPLTLILRRHPGVPPSVSAGLDTVAVRVPAHPVALALIQASGVPIAAPSANLFGHSSPTTARHVWDDLSGRIDLILDGGPTPVGVESTVLDLTSSIPTILRPGGVTLEALKEIIGEVRTLQNIPPGEGKAQVSPGLLGKHYAPHARLILLKIDNPTSLHQTLRRIVKDETSKGTRVGLLLASEDLPFVQDLPVKLAVIGSLDDLATVARNLYSGIRQLDQENVDLILARDFGNFGLGMAIRDRLTRAASEQMTDDDQPHHA